MHVFLDVSRLLTSVRHTSPSGIDRVEMAYARRWAARPEREVTFVAQGLWGNFAAVPRPRVLALIDALLDAWTRSGTEGPSLQTARRQTLAIHAGLLAGQGRAALRQALARWRRPVFLLVSHASLERPGPIAALQRAGAAFVPLIHDLIPLTHPEYTRPGQVPRHGRRIATTAALADGIITNSRATAASLAPHLAAAGRAPPLRIAPLGIEPRILPRTSPEESAPYFLSIGTIEPRKNHLLLLNLWRDLAERFGPAAPRLKLLGRRGWENENILDMLERCAPLRGLVDELGPQPDSRVTSLLAGARALLFPSFVEGFGLPVAEALALGVPVICSDLAPLRDVGGQVPEYLCPLDGAAWRQAVLDYAAPDSPRRAAQLARLAGWQPTRWESHFAQVDELLDGVCGGVVLPATAPRRPAFAWDTAPRPAPTARPEPALAEQPLADASL